MTDMRRGTVGGTRDISGPAALSLGTVLVLFGLSGFLAVGDGMLLGLFRVTMSHNFFHLGVGAVLFCSAILGSREARAANTSVGLLLLGASAAGLAGLDRIAPNGADVALYLGAGLTLTVFGFRAPR